MMVFYVGSLTKSSLLAKTKNYYGAALVPLEAGDAVLADHRQNSANSLSCFSITYKNTVTGSRLHEPDMPVFHVKPIAQASRAATKSTNDKY